MLSSPEALHLKMLKTDVGQNNPTSTLDPNLRVGYKYTRDPKEYYYQLLRPTMVNYPCIWISNRTLVEPFKNPPKTL